MFKHQLSAAAVKDLFELMTTRDGVEGDGLGEGCGFEAGDRPKNADHVVSRMRKYVPLVEVFMWVVPIFHWTYCTPIFSSPNAT